MADDWQWFWAGEHGRDRILRDELEGLQAQTVAARERSSRLNSQLASLQGSIETRLAALSAAFDAYVELGDVREQLSGYPDTAAIRRDTAQAIDALSRGGAAPPVDHRETDYWLTYATNAVIALVAGRADAAAEQRAVELDRDAELFIVAAAGALGHGAAVADRVPPLLVCDGTLTSHQVALWTAAHAGVYGAILGDIHAVWAGSLRDSAAGADWLAWVRRASGAEDAEGVLRWLDAQTSSTAPVPPVRAVPGASGPDDAGPDDADPVEPAPSKSDPTVLLRQVVGELVGRGMPGEAELLSRSRDLRARIENPPTAGQVKATQGKATTGAAGRDGEAEAGPVPVVTVLQQVQAALVATDPGSPEHTELLDWIGDGLATTIDPLLQEAASGDPVAVSTRTPGGSVPVTSEGPLAVALDRAQANIALRFPSLSPKLYGSVVIAAAFAVLALVSAIATNAPGLPVVLLLSALAAGVVVFQTLRQRTAGLAQKDADLKQLQQNIAASVEAARQGERDRQQRHTDLASRAVALRSRLSGAQTGRVVSGASGAGAGAGSAAAGVVSPP